MEKMVTWLETALQKEARAALALNLLEDLAKGTEETVKAKEVSTVTSRAYSLL